MNNNTDIRFFTKSAYKQYASCGGSEIYRAKSTVSRACTSCLVKMSYQDNGTACPLSYQCNSFQYRTYFISSVDVHRLTYVPLNRIEYHKPCPRINDCSFDSLVRQRKRICVLNDIKHPALICTCFHKARLYSIAQPILCRLIDYIEGLCHLHPRQGTT